ncbi:acid phosphatase [Actinocatenispora thailandica]|uniref:Acid phosphatase n=1 Tax=Actinocatenispora thailandica TaxID=227318 RepID=A0A7R7HXW7_9ACTN|nr:alkaline phosphatase family protein [Actinocatenispora thailandica]BCJ36637.1 acid phosphatase [Actinocatenispora thailandica]
MVNRTVRVLPLLAVALSLVLLAGCGSSGGSPRGAGATSPSVSGTRSPAASGTSGRPAPPAAGAVPQPAHVLVVVFENKGYDNVVGSSQAPYLNLLAKRGALLTDSHGVAHPSQPNYLALFSGSTHGITDDSCPHTLHAGSLGAQLLGSGHSYASYAEGLPSAGFAGCDNGNYARKHAPWTNFANVPARTQLPLRALPTDYAKLPQVGFVIPDLCSDMHNCSVSTGDRWLSANLGGYVSWAQTHHSLLIVTFDEDEGSGANRIPTILAGQPVRPGHYGGRVDHYTMLRTLEAMYGLRPLGTAAHRTPLTDVWR